MSLDPNFATVSRPVGHDRTGPVVLVVEDNPEASELDQVLFLNGYCVIGTDHGKDAVRQAREIRPDLLLIDLDVPLLYELVTARRIVKQAQLWHLPVVIVTREDKIDSESIWEVGARRNEYVTRLSDYDRLQDLLDYLLPVLPPALPNEFTDSNNFGVATRNFAQRSVSSDAYRPV